MQPKFFGYLLFLFIFSAFSLVLTSSLDAKIIGDRTISYKYISTGFEHSCAIAEDGTTYCWGGAGRGQLGRGTGGSSEKIKLALVNMAQLFLKKIRLFKLVRGIIQLAL